MEVRNKDICIKVDNARFVMTPHARITMDGALAFMNIAVQTGRLKELNVGMLELLTRLTTPQQKKETLDKMDDLLDSIGETLGELDKDTDPDKW